MKESDNNARIRLPEEKVYFVKRKSFIDDAGKLRVMVMVFESFIPTSTPEALRLAGPTADRGQSDDTIQGDWCNCNTVADCKVQSHAVSY